ncbi:hypothetical protein VTO42DRAFT_4338 [Malbranchea cinnamomea]
MNNATAAMQACIRRPSYLLLLVNNLYNPYFLSSEREANGEGTRNGCGIRELLSILCLFHNYPHTVFPEIHANDRSKSRAFADPEFRLVSM